MLVTSEVARSVVDFIPLNERAMLLRIQTSHRVMNIYKVYAPTKDKPDEEAEAFYNSIEELIRVTKRGEITFILGDFNSKVGSGAEGDIVGKYGLSERNLRGDRLVQFRTEHSLFIANKFFKHHQDDYTLGSLPETKKSTS
ncbi:Craniofacial development protein 2 [Zootermopsis nevadensis]|uniref:Craniofacial development protein 2 n=1 Tax=Zootermopsis nevadensis TaxID=136037 RepID=A0A067RKZ5_ZOONE|nr:Craniofacial development protein 2 [Zootermopsis nevadensis]